MCKYARGQKCIRSNTAPCSSYSFGILLILGQNNSLSEKTTFLWKLRVSKLTWCQSKLQIRFLAESNILLHYAIFKIPISEKKSARTTKADFKPSEAHLLHFARMERPQIISLRSVSYRFAPFLYLTLGGFRLISLFSFPLAFFPLFSMSGKKRQKNDSDSDWEPNLAAEYESPMGSDSPYTLGLFGYFLCGSPTFV